MLNSPSNRPIQFEKAVTLVGGGVLSPAQLEQSMALAPHLVAADGAADRLGAWGHTPDAVIGDMDSISDLSEWTGRSHVVALPEQDSTDFEKCLYATEAPFYVAAGFTGRRADHMLAVFHAMLARPQKRIVLLGEDDAIALMPPGRTVELFLSPGARVSLFPLLPARGVESTGLLWPIEGLAFQTGRQIGTSNQAVSDRVSLQVNGPGILVMVEPDYLSALARGLRLTT